MSNSIYKESLESQEIKALANGPGEELASQVRAEAELTNSEEGKKKYQREAAFNQDRYNIGNMYEDGYKVETEEDGSMVVPNIYVKPGERQFFGYDFADGHKKDKFITGMLERAAIPGRVIAGGMLDAAQGTMELIDDVVEYTGMQDYDVETSKRREWVKDLDPEFLRQTSGWGEDIARAFAQFGTGYGGAFGFLGKMGMKSLLGKDVVAAMAGGQTFDPSEGSLGTLAAEFNLLPDIMRFMDSSQTVEEHGQMVGRLSLLLEEAGIGGGIFVVKKMLQTAKRGYYAYGEEMMRGGVKKYREATGTINGPTGGIGADKAIDADGMIEAVDQIATGFQIKGGSVDEFMAMAKESGISATQAQKSWNTATKEKIGLARHTLGAATEGPSRVDRQRGELTIFGSDEYHIYSKASDLLDPDMNYSVNDLKGFYKNQISQGNIQQAEYDSIIQPLFDQFSGVDPADAKMMGGDIQAYMEATLPDFNTRTLAEGATKFPNDPLRGTRSNNVFDPATNLELNTMDEGGRDLVEQLNELVSDGAMTQREADNLVSRADEVPPNLDLVDMYSVDYKEHLFTAADPRFGEGFEGFVNAGHFDERHVKGFGRTSFMADPDTGIKHMNMVQELQSDYAIAARQFGEHTDAEVRGMMDKVLKLEHEETYFNNVADILGPEMLGKEKYASFMKKFEAGGGSIGESGSKTEQMFEDLVHKVTENAYMGKDAGQEGLRDIMFGELRRQVAGKSVFTKDKAWIRQVMRPIIEDTLREGVNRIALVSDNIIYNRTGGVGPNKKYSKEYPKILKRYFLDIGVPEKNIHMPANSSESFYVDLPREWVDDMFAGNRPALPAYSFAGAPLVGHQMMGDESGN